MPKDIFSPSPCASFIVANRAALASAAHLLGGPAASKRVQCLVGDLSLALPLTRRLNRELDALEDLLALRHAHDLDRVEAARFNRIDPLDPAVEEICQLLDGLCDSRAAEAHHG
ncbi:hypothetical protein [Roseivivax sp.]